MGSGGDMQLEKAIERVSKDFTADNVRKLAKALKRLAAEDIECYGFTDDRRLVVRCDDEVREMTLEEFHKALRRGTAAKHAA